MRTAAVAPGRIPGALPAANVLAIPVRRGRPLRVFRLYSAGVTPRPVNRNLGRVAYQAEPIRRTSSEARHGAGTAVRLRLMCDTVASLDARHSAMLRELTWSSRRHTPSDGTVQFSVCASYLYQAATGYVAYSMASDCRKEGS